MRQQHQFLVAESSDSGLDGSDGPILPDKLVAAVTRLRTGGLRVHGQCRYSRGDQFDWPTVLTGPVADITEVSLFDIHRQHRPVAAEYARSAVERTSD